MTAVSMADFQVELDFTPITPKKLGNEHRLFQYALLYRSQLE